jgi:NAD(P)-dependent dehydrogenase (short-subunit alcohol dehydrogenase family)
MRIQGAVALITGAERGLGRVLAMALARRGARVVASGLERDTLESLRAAIHAAGGQARALLCDVRGRGQIAAVVDAAETAFGAVDLLVNNAGITLGGDIRLVSEKDWDAVFDVNLRGAVRMVDAVLPGMLARGRGHIVNIASAAGLAAPALWIPYAASKFALVGFSEGLRAALHSRGIAVSVACPMWIQTDMLTSVEPPLAGPPPGGPASSRASMAGLWLTARLRGRPMAAETVAHRIVRGIERERFMIYTHRATRLLVAARALAPDLFARLWQRVNDLDEQRHRRATRH